jgi:hypothetical protein
MPHHIALHYTTLHLADECEQFFTGVKKGRDKEGPSRFKKDLLLYKNLALGPEHRVIIIGTSKEPENGDLKELKGFFDKFLYFPYPDYSSRRLVLRYYLEYQICEGSVQYSTHSPFSLPPFVPPLSYHLPSFLPPSLPSSIPPPFLFPSSCVCFLY